jgi:hypothetical protein
MSIKNMATEKNNFGRELFTWQVPEYDKHERSRAWYLAAGSLASIFIIYSLITGNFLFAIIIIAVSLVVILTDGRDPDMINVHLTSGGVIVARKFYDYDELKNFSIIYKPTQDVKNLYFEFKNIFKPRLSFPLNDLNPLLIRENLLRYLPEDLERTNEPTSEGLAKLLKL